MDYKKFYNETLNREEVEKIIYSINSSMDELKDSAYEQGISIDCGGHLYRWNYIFKNIQRMFKEDKYNTVKIDRGNLWKPVVIYNKDTKIVYLLMKNDNIKRIKNNEKDSKRHYSKVFNVINEKFRNYSGEQLNLLNTEELIDNDLLNELNKLTKDIKEVECCKMICFDELMGKVINIEECIYNSKMEVMNVYNLSEYIVAEIDEITDVTSKLDETRTQIEKNVIDDIELSYNKEKIKDLIEKKDHIN